MLGAAFVPALLLFQVLSWLCFLPETGFCRRGSIVLPLPSGEKGRKLFRELPVAQSCGDSAARSVPGIAGLRWRGRGTGPWGSWGLSGLVLGHLSLLAPHPRCQADASGLCPFAVPGANNTREEAACCRQRLCPKPTLGSDAFPAHAERVLPRPPAPACRHVPGAAAASSLCHAGPSTSVPAAGAAPLPAGFPDALPYIPASPHLAQLSLQLRLGVMQIPTLFLLLCPVASAQLPSFISVPKCGCLHWIFSFAGGKGNSS